MLSIDLQSLCGDDTDDIVKGVNEATKNIEDYIAARCKNQTDEQMFENLYCDIIEVCSFWSGNTYIGVVKKKPIKNTFQKFFKTLMRMLLSINDNGQRYEKEFAKAVLYRGNIYRYLGNHGPSRNTVKPIYNNIYVSWSKSPKSSYIESKLYGVVTWMSCEITAPLYGIDLEALGCSRSSEHEVVFPTIKKYITEIKYISEDIDDET